MVGVIGGNGVAATNRLCEMIERKMTAAGAFRDAHHPEMIVWQATTVPSRSMFLEGRGPDWRPDYIRIAKALKSLGCNLCCMCCNTAHYAIDEVEKESGVRFIDLLKEVAVTAKERGTMEFELFCSDGARKFDLYGRTFANVFPDAKIVYPSEERQRLVTKVICDAKNKARFSSRNDLGSPALLLDRLISEAKHPVILGCTDLRGVYGVDELLHENVAVDSLECLADAIIRECGGAHAF